MTDAWPFGDLKPAHYRTILIDCPWKFSGGTKGRPQHYRRMTDIELAALPIHLLAHPDGAFVYPWITSAMLQRAMAVIRQWQAAGARVKDSIRYSGRALVWIKTSRALNGLPPALFIHPGSLHVGQGFTTRKNAEDLLIFKYGHPKRLARDVHEVVFEPVREHSRKPEESYARVERLSAGPRAELFARSRRRGWETWGDETDKFYGQQPLAA